MKILVDARPLQTYSRFRGIGRYVNHIIELFREDPEVFFLWFKDKNIDKRVQNSIVMGTPRRGITFTDKIFLTRLLRKQRFNVFHSTAFALPCKIPGVKYIITIYDLTPLLFPQFSSRKNIYLFKKILGSAKKADQIIAISQNTKKDLINTGNFSEKNIKVIYPPVDIRKGEINSDFTDFTDIPPEYVFYAGGTDGNKNVKTIMKALNIFQKPLVISGLIDNKKKEELLDIINSENRGLVHFTGFISDKELAFLYNRAKLFVFPSLYEGFGFPPLEALINGTPSVVSRSGSIEEVMKDAAVYLDDPLDEIELAEKIDLLWEDSAIGAEIVNKSEKILKEYSIDKFKKELKNIYFSIGPV
ncbi:MAG: glycosyltransferase family 1 protein [Acidobacteriota bacterium]